MRSPYGLEIIENCLGCRFREERLFCNLPQTALQSFESIKSAVVYPKASVVFVEGQEPRGIYVVCSGRAKLSTCASDGKTLITQIAEPGDVLGLSSAVSGKPYEATAETLDPCQLNFVKREDFLRFLGQHGEACLRVAQHLSNSYHTAYEQIRSLGLSHSAGEKLARLLLAWCGENGKQTEQGIRLKVTLTHEELAQIIGTSRETVTRLLGDFRSKHLIHVEGSTLIVQNKSALERMINV